MTIAFLLASKNFNKMETTNQDGQFSLEKILSIVRDFMANRDAGDYIKTLDEVLMAYVVTDDYTALPFAERNTVINCTCELKDLIIKLLKFKEKYCILGNKYEQKEDEISQIIGIAI
jgi:hypothetical protein